MSFLDKLDYLMRLKNINKNILAKESGIPYTTIDAFYKKGYSNAKLSTIKKLCSYFSVSLDYFVIDDIPVTEYKEAKNNTLNLSDIEKEIIITYRKSDDIGKAIVLRSLGITDNNSLKGEIKEMA